MKIALSATLTTSDGTEETFALAEHTVDSSHRLTEDQILALAAELLMDTAFSIRQGDPAEIFTDQD